jgi:hypothetical protein
MNVGFARERAISIGADRDRDRLRWWLQAYGKSPSSS